MIHFKARPVSYLYYTRIINSYEHNVLGG